MSRPLSEPPQAGAAPRRSLREWLICTGIVSLLVSLADALLLQRKRGIFTGGFLAADQLETAGERLSFGLLSVVSDAALVSLLVIMAYRVGRGFRLTRHAASVLALCSAAAPFVVFDVLAYQLHKYLGDSFDLGLMFDLTGRSAGEMLAVSSGHLAAPVAATLLGVGSIAALTLAVQRFSPDETYNVRIPLLPAIALLVVGTAAHVGARLQDPSLDDALRRKPSGQVMGWAAERLTDCDRDGHGLLGRPPDPAAFDARVYPYAIDWPGNGVDENGIGGDLPAGAAYSEPTGVPIWQQHPDVVLVVLESYRADAVGAEVNGQPVTPVLDALAARGVSSSRAYSHNGYTAQSRFHLLTGSLAGLRGGTSLIDDFKANGYEVGYFSGQDDSFGGAEFAVGMDRADVAFDARSARDLRYSTFSTAGSLAVAAGVVETQIARFLDTRTQDKPLFLYVNLHDTHFPYWHRGIEPLVSRVVLDRSDIRPERAAELREMYLNTAANVDRSIGRILDRVKAHLGRTPGVIVTADHGESLFDGGFLGHGYALNDAQTRIPLIVSNLSVVVREPFGQADLRDLLSEAFASPAGSRAGAALDPDEGPAVFQYVGLLQRPRMVASRALHGQAIVDLRPGSAPEMTALGRATVARWESMIAARAGRGHQ